MKRTTLSMVLAAAISSASVSAYAANDWQEGAKDAWIDGTAETTLLLNTNLNNFDINTDVENGEITLTGKVGSEVDKSLAGELVRNIDGVTDVHNELTVINDDGEEDDEGIMDTLNDSKISTVVKTRLLFSSDVSGTSIDVEVNRGVVTLTGTVDSDAERDLAVEIAKSTDDVRDVENNIEVAD